MCHCLLSISWTKINGENLPGGLQEDKQTAQAWWQWNWPKAQWCTRIHWTTSSKWRKPTCGNLGARSMPVRNMHIQSVPESHFYTCTYMYVIVRVWEYRCIRMCILTYNMYVSIYEPHMCMWGGRSSWGAPTIATCCHLPVGKQSYQNCHFTVMGTFPPVDMVVTFGQCKIALVWSTSGKCCEPYIPTLWCIQQ